MLVRTRSVKFKSSDFRLFVLPPWWSIVLVLWQRRIMPIGAHATLQHAPRLADLGLLLSAAVRVEARKKSHCRDQKVLAKGKRRFRLGESCPGAGREI